MQAVAPDSVTVTVGTELWYGSSDFAPHYIAANRYGTLTMSRGAVVSAGIGSELNRSRRFDYAFGAEGAAGYRSGADYDRYFADTQSWGSNFQRPRAIRLQQLYGELKWRSLFLSAGMKERGSAMLDNRLSSGDLTHSANTRPIPQVRAGFLDFTDIPLTRGELQIEGVIAYGKFADDSWWRSHFNYYHGEITSSTFYLYRRLYFRTSPRHRLNVTFGVQSAGQFGRVSRHYFDGKLTHTDVDKAKFVDFFKILVPASGEDFVYGNTLGSWDLKARWNINASSSVAAYFQWPWEDGSGMAKRNGFDGLYGLEYKSNVENAIISGAVVEYLDLTNQSGPVHWDPGDHPGSPIVSEARGADDYYNNAYYNSYAYFGQTIGTPMVMGPIYNTDGYLAMIANRVRGIHIGAEGNVVSGLNWRLLAGWRKAYGNGYEPLLEPITSFSAMAEARWRPKTLSGLTLTLQAAFDRGKLPGNSTGVAVGGSFTTYIFSKR